MGKRDLPDTPLVQGPHDDLKAMQVGYLYARVTL